MDPIAAEHRPGPKQQALFELEQFTAKTIGQYEQRREELKLLKQDLKDKLLEFPDYREAEELSEGARETKKSIKDQILLADKEAILINEKIRETNEELKDIKETLSGSIEEYTKSSGQKTIKDHLGRERKIKKTFTVK